MSKAEKRERQKENRERAREERERLLRHQKQMKTFRSLLIVLVPIMVILIVVSLTTGGDDNSGKASKPITRTYSSPPPMTIDENATYTATMDTSEGTITLALDPKTAPIATNNFVFLARNRFYDGLTIHRASKDFVIQGGDPKGDGSGGPGYTVVGEVPTDHYPVGALAAAKGGTEPAGTMGSQFFIVTGTNGETLPNDYARFGDVTKGLDVAQKIESFAPASGDGTPTQKVTINKVTVKENGKTLTSTTSAPATSSTTG